MTGLEELWQEKSLIPDAMAAVAARAERAKRVKEGMARDDSCQKCLEGYHRSYIFSRTSPIFFFSPSAPNYRLLIHQLCL